MNKALELAAECDMVIEDNRVMGVSSDGMPDGPAHYMQLEAFFRRAQAMALRDAAREFRKGDPAPKHWAVTGLERMADELEAGK